MSDTRETSQVLAATGIWRAIPGVGLAGVLALVALLCSKQIGASLAAGGASPVSPVLLGILLGVLWRQFVGIGDSVQRGVDWMLGSVLRIGIALVGLRLTLPGLAQVGLIAIPVVVSCITVALVTSNALGRLLGLSVGFRRLLAVGSAVCGCTAIVATAPAIRAKPLETSTALACVVLIGSLGMVVYPWLAAAVFGPQSLPIGVFLGSAIHDTSQVIGASVIAAQQFDAPEVVAFASATKLLRNLSIIVLVLVPALAWLSRQDGTGESLNGSSARGRAVPAFVVAFMVLVLVRAAGDQVFASDTDARALWSAAMDVAKTLSELLMIGGMTALGLSISLTQIYQVGPRPACAALLVAASVAACGLGLTYALIQVLH